jgi:hypothetical protein
VYNILPSAEKKELYPGDREDVIDFSLPGHEQKLLEGWYALEGVFGNKYRWIGGRAGAMLKPSHAGPQKVRVRGHAPEGRRITIELFANGAPAGQWTLDRNGLFIVEANVPAADSYKIDVKASPVWKSPNDERELTVTLSMLRLVPQDDSAIS